MEFEPDKVFSPQKSKERDFEMDLRELASYEAKKGEAGSRHTYYDIGTPGREEWLESLTRERESWEQRRSKTFSQASWPRGPH